MNRGRLVTAVSCLAIAVMAASATADAEDATTSPAPLPAANPAVPPLQIRGNTSIGNDPMPVRSLRDLGVAPPTKARKRPKEDKPSPRSG